MMRSRSFTQFCLALTFSAALVASLSACVKTEVTTYQRVQGSQVDKAYLKPGVDFSRYSQLYAYPMEIYYPQGSGAPSKEELQAIREVFHDAFLSAIGDDYAIVAKPNAQALGVRASLVDLLEDRPADKVPQELALLVNSGQLTFLMELTDSATGEVLARAADQEKQSASSGAPEGMEAAAERWAGMFRNFLDNNLSSN